MGHTGLVLTGGGARAAYQVGALRALADIAGPGPIPFGVLAGISAGAINGAVLGCGAADFAAAAERLQATWASLTPDRVFRTGALALAGVGGRWIRDLSAGGLVGKTGINYLLDPSPLRALLAGALPMGRLRRHLRTGRLRAVALSATNYHTGAGVTFFEGAPDIEPWIRSTRVGVRARLTLDHVMASAAIPVFFPPVRIERTFYGDGCVRMICPLSPAIHLGAERIVAISVRHLRSAAETARDEVRATDDALPVSEIAGVLLNAVFLDSLDSDVERLERINRTLALIPRERLGRGELELREVPVLVLRPSLDLGKLAADEYGRFPRMLRYLLKGIGATGHAGEDLLSYLAFEPVYVHRVMDLGYADTMARRAEVEAFLSPGERGDRRERSGRAAGGLRAR
ncbi:patatin-like phospholipase family protein [Anaeromyxobacter dehalogenans]|uniref:Patatin n=1 Tax=Anaeromyxobacter dehalogenans (strain 2CP-C) TaxID=290397 RepID=Q2IHS9_ANADE|nr:patatin-like phospholipase family protein [Anaeromyxobacter dehalogenans]ABC81207.1 Patatin [Anaeromyxobacter dehalogenans 2CP-C]